ncbi:hypothetical protein GCK72_003196 [Caenorhabditis remanei]|uniref:Uncharacterized protein n=1 Tax=Caenorhabditis remanei TaxID=31234 RepID=A0A6A5HT51_CAERE|nr:hypothetical protein GCK72_003196 [Caenorhabditis remanei]KAF1771370.1 hypothetical protein GCK72_003196 [Caenorhabditis remanei]
MNSPRTLASSSITGSFLTVGKQLVISRRESSRNTSPVSTPAHASPETSLIPAWSSLSTCLTIFMTTRESRRMCFTLGAVIVTDIDILRTLEISI